MVNHRVSQEVDGAVLEAYGKTDWGWIIDESSFLFAGVGPAEGRMPPTLCRCVLDKPRLAWIHSCVFAILMCRCNFESLSVYFGPWCCLLSPLQVIKISALGHRKRIIASLAERPYEEAPSKSRRLSPIMVSETRDVETDAVHRMMSLRALRRAAIIPKTQHSLRHVFLIRLQPCRCCGLTIAEQEHTANANVVDWFGSICTTRMSVLLLASM